MSYSIAMSGTSIPRTLVVAIGLGALALIGLGRYLAPIELLVASLREGHDHLKGVGPATTLGIPLILIGAQILQLVTPWMRTREPLRLWRSTLAMIALQGATIVLVVGACLTNKSLDVWQQPYWLWVAVPLAFLLGLGLRVCWTGYSWIVLALLAGLTLPGIWVVLSRFERPPLTARHEATPVPPALLVTRALDADRVR
jgi:hypothetical protein